MEVFHQGVFVLAGTRAVQAPRHPAAPAHKVNHIRETVSADWAEMSKYRVVRGLVKKGGGEEQKKWWGEEGEEEFIHQVSLRAQYVLHCWAGRQSQTGWGLSQPNPREGTGPGQGRLWAPPDGPPSLPGPVSPGYECWSPPETCTSAPEAHWWDLLHTASAGVVGGRREWRAAD